MPAFVKQKSSLRASKLPRFKGRGLDGPSISNTANVKVSVGTTKLVVEGANLCSSCVITLCSSDNQRLIPRRVKVESAARAVLRVPGLDDTLIGETIAAAVKCGSAASSSEVPIATVVDAYVFSAPCCRAAVHSEPGSHWHECCVGVCATAPRRNPR